MNDLPDFEKAQYIEPPAGTILTPERQLSPGYEFKSEAWSEHEPDRGFAHAMLYGSVAALGGCAAYATFTILTHIEIGFLALLVGILVGGAMMRATGGRGGRRYQVAAALLTYFAVSMAAVPELLYSLNAQGDDVSHLSGRAYLSLALYGIASPFLALKHLVSGAIGLFILYLGVQAAWKTAAGKTGNG